MIVLDRNPFEIPATEIGQTRVLQTIFNGSVVHDTSTSDAAHGDGAYLVRRTTETRPWARHLRP